MNQSLAALKDTRHTSQPMELSGDMSNMQVPGLEKKTEDGRMITLSTQEAVELRGRSEGCLIKSEKARFSQKEKEEFTRWFGLACAVQKKKYGELTSSEDIGLAVRGFLYLLKDYKMAKIIESLEAYIKTERDVPTPSDLAKIIETLPLSEEERDEQRYTRLIFQRDKLKKFISEDDLRFISSYEQKFTPEVCGAKNP